MKVFQNRKGKWCVDFQRNYKRVRRVIGDSKRQAEDVAASIKADIVRERYGFLRAQQNVYFEDFAKEFLSVYSRPNKRSWRRDEASAKNLIDFIQGKFLAEVDPEIIEKYKAKRKTEVSPATANRELALLKTMLSKAVEWGKLKSNPAAKVKKFKEAPGRERILTPMEIKDLADAANSHLKPVLIIALNTGMRRGEILGLRWESVNFAQGSILIEDSKSGRSRKVPMNNLVAETLRQIERGSEFVFFNPATKDPVKDVKTSFKTACKNAGIKGLRFHDLRHTAASRMIEGGADLVTVSKILGHSTIQMTMRYCHPTAETMRQAVDILASAFGKSRHKTDIGTEITLRNPFIIKGLEH